MKQVLAVRVGAKKAVGHIVSKRWWPTVRDTIVVLAAALGFFRSFRHFAILLLDEPFFACSS